MNLNRQFVEKFKMDDKVLSKEFGVGKVVEVRSWIINDFPVKIIFENDIKAFADGRSFSLKGQYMMAGPCDKDIELL